MTSIIPFRFGTVGERHEGDLSALLATGTESINTSAFVYERLIPAVRDWTNQELADLARVQYLLSRAGVPLETDRGITDEGDPWFVFCDPQGEVFVHICRMGMVYLLDGPSLESPLKGASFDALVKSFIDRATTKAAALNVVPLNKDNKVYLHPSVMLTALIWSLFLLSDQMTNAAYASAMEEDPGAGEPASYDVDTAFALLAEALHDNGTELDEIAGHKALGKLEVVARDGVAGDKASAVAQTSLLNSTIITSLSAIALSFGLLQPAESKAASLPEPAVVTATAATIEVVPVAEAEGNEPHKQATSDDTARSFDEHQLTHDASTSWFQLNSNTNLADLIGTMKVVSLDLLGTLAHDRDMAIAAADMAITAANPLRDAVLQGGTAAGITRGNPTRQGGATNETSLAQSTETASKEETAAASSSPLSLSSASSSIQTFAQLADQIVKHSAGLIVVTSTEAQPVATAKVVGHLHELLVTTYTDTTSEAVKALLKFEVADPDAITKGDATKLGEQDVFADGKSDAPAGVVVITAPPKASTMPVEVPAQPQFGAYNPAAKALVDYLLSKDKDIVVINLANEIIVLDKSALDEATDIAFAKSWSVEGGGIVSTIGHFSDYKDFGLLG